MRYISLFSGIEAASVAWEPLGWEPVAFSEIEPFPCAVLEQRFPDVPNLGDITQINWKEVIAQYGAIDLVVGGSPCQSFSIAQAGREGLSGASGLMFEYIRGVSEIRPIWFLWENVYGTFSAERGHAFKQLLDSMVELGYELAWRLLDSQFFGVAQRRRRVFLVGHLRAQGAIEVLFEPSDLRWDYPSSLSERARLARIAGKGSDSAGCFYALRERCGKPGGGKGPLIQKDVSGTLVNHQEQAIFEPDGESYKVRRFTPLECERLQGLPDGWTDIYFNGRRATDAERYKAIGNSFSVPVVAWIGSRIDRCERLGADALWS